MFNIWTLRHCRVIPKHCSTDVSKLRPKFIPRIGTVVPVRFQFPFFFKKGCPKGGVVIWASEFLVTGIGLTANAGVPTLAFGHPFHWKGNWASAAAARSSQGNTSKVLPPMSHDLHLFISQSSRKLNSSFIIAQRSHRIQHR